MGKKSIIIISLITMLLLTNVVPFSSLSLELKSELNDVRYNKSNQFENSYHEKRETRVCDYIQSKIVPSEIIVKFKKDINIQTVGSDTIKTHIPSIDNLIEKFKITSFKKMFQDETNSALSNIYMLKFSELFDPLIVANEYKNNPNIEYAEPNIIYESCTQPDDTFFDDQWALYQTNDFDIDATDAWDLTTGSEDVVIAIVDSGVYYNHPDLADNIWSNEDEIANNSIDDDGNGFVDDIHGWDFVDTDITPILQNPFANICLDEDYITEDNNPRDAHGHGTHCAGIASAVGNNGKGIAGVCWNCKIMPVRAGFKFLYFGQTVCVYETDDLVKAITYAADNNADIISMSWGGYSYSNAIHDAINYAYSKGCVLIAAAGNDNSDERHYPSSYDYVISVASTNKKDERWTEKVEGPYGDSYTVGSNYGEFVDVAAPGVDILSTILPTELFYAEKTGTSMAAPHVAGVAGLLKSKYPDASPEMITALIKTGADSIQTDKSIGTGRINAYRSLTVKPIFAYIDHIADYTNIQGKLVVKGSADGENFKNYKLEYGQGRDPKNWELLVSSNTPVFHGEFCSLDTENIDDGAYTIRLTVESNDNSKYTDTSMITVNNIEHQTIYVDDNNIQGPWKGTEENPYRYLQDGIDSAGNNETVYIKKGTYLPSGTDGKGTFLIDKRIKLEGEDNLNSIITHSGKQERCLIQLKSDNVEITNCCIKTKTGKYDWGGGAIDIQSDANHIHNNYISVVEGWESINLQYSSSNIIEDNTITSEEASTCFRGIGLAYYSDNNIIRRNTIKNIQNAGVGLWYFCEDNLIENNTIDGPYYGIIIMDGVQKNTVKNNLITNTGGDLSSTGGIIIEYATNNKITGNRISNSKSNGMHLEFEANSNIISSNNFSNNQRYGVHLDHYWFVIMPSELPTFCKNNVFYCNTFINNLEGNVRDDGSNTWYNKQKNIGNYYDDYNGSDRNDDGIGEESYTVEGWRIKIDAWSGKEILRLPITHKDKYPFIEPPGECNSKGLNRFVQVKFFEKHCNLMLKLFLNFLENHDILKELFL